MPHGLPPSPLPPPIVPDILGAAPDLLGAALPTPPVAPQLPPDMAPPAGVPVPPLGMPEPIGLPPEMLAALPRPEDIAPPPTPVPPAVAGMGAPPIMFPELPAPEPVRPWADVRKSAKTLENLSGQQTALDEQMGALRERFNAATTDEERATITEEGIKVREQQRKNTADIAKAREEGAWAVRRGDAQQRVQVAKAMETQQERVGAEFADIAKREETRLGEIAQRKAAAEQERQEAQTEYRGILRAGPMKDAGWGAMLASMAGEMLMATTQKRTPNLQGIYETFRKSNEQAWRGKLEAAQQGITDIGDRITRLGAERSEAERQSALQRSAIIEEAQREFQGMQLRATTEREKANYARVDAQLQQEKEQAQQQARQAGEDLQMRRSEWTMSMATKEAELRKKRAEAEIAERKARRAGGGRSAGRGVFAAHEVHIPEIEKLVAEFPKTTGGRKRAATVRELYPAQVGALKRLAEMEAMIEDYDARVGDWSRFTSSEQYDSIKVAQSLLVSSMARLLNGPGTLTEPDMQRASGIVEIPTAGLNNKSKALAKIRQLRRISEDKIREHFGAAGLRPKAIEEIIGYVQSRAVSMTDVAEQAMATSVQRIRDPKAPLEDRKAAVKDLLQRERRSAKDEPAGRLAGARSLVAERTRLVEQGADEALLDAVDRELAALRGKIAKDMGRRKLPPQYDRIKGTPAYEEKLREVQAPERKVLQAIDETTGARIMERWRALTGE